jgi:Undecaprenyl-phosphate glucose phosphotransferase
MTSYDIRDMLKSASANVAESASSSPQTDMQEQTTSIPTAEGVASVHMKAAFSPVVMIGTLRLVEFLVITLIGFTVHALYLYPEIPLNFFYVGLIMGVAVMMAIALQSIGAYSLSALRNFVLIAIRITGAWAVVFALTFAIIFFAKLGENLSRIWLGSWFFGGLSILLALRFALSIFLSSFARAGRFDRRTAIVGGGDYAEDVIKTLEEQPDCGIKIVGVFDDRNDDRSPDLVYGYPKLGTVDDLVAYARRTGLDLVIFTVPISAEFRITQMLKKLWVLPIDIRLSAHASKLKLRPRSYSYIGMVPVLDVYDKPIADWDLVIKWIFDKIVGSLMIICLSPILLATAIAVKLDSRGPAFFKQRRYGFNNELIEIYKFRSMYVDQCDVTASQLVTKGDPRVTKVGRFIRKTSLDELPQLFNVVFKGNLSLVGPRPHALHAKAEDRLYDQVVDNYFARHKVKPGITGLAQIKGWRGETDTQEKIQKRVEYDIEYIENWSVLEDLKILVKTPFALLKTENAY